MAAFRLGRIAGIALAFATAFTLSQRATIARYGEATPGTIWAIGALTFFFLVGAIATERSQRRESDVRKDVLWGLALGGILGIVIRLTLLA